MGSQLNFETNMKRNESASKKPFISDEAVSAKTGKTWPQWFAFLDKAGATKWSHKEIVAYLNQEHGVGSWWQQMVTVTYEQARGLRAKHQKPEGFEISGSKTIAVPIATLFKAWFDEKIRRRWLSEADNGFTIRKATPNKSLRITWIDGRTSIAVDFYAKGNGKSQVALNHGKLKNAKEAAAKKRYWAEQLDRLKNELE